MKLLRTPDERFENLEGYPFAPNYVEVPAGDEVVGQGGDTGHPEAGQSLRIHYVDEGPADGEVVLLLHGEPSWSYLYRTMIPPLVEAGYRVIAPDLPGFGRSDKPGAPEDYSYQRYVDWMEAALFGPAKDSQATDSSAKDSQATGLDLTGITLFCQDWGGLIGLRLLAEHPERFVGCVVANTGLPTGEETPSDAFLSWQKFSQETPEFDVGVLIAMATTTDLSDQIVAGYDAPFPDDSYKAGARIFPSLVPTSPDDPAAPANKAAWDVLRQLDIPFLTAFSDQDPITGGGHKVFQKLVPGAQGQAHTTTVGGGHFLQEDRGPELAAVVDSFIAANR